MQGYDYLKKKVQRKLDQCHNKSFVTVVAAMPLPLSAATSANLFL